MKRLSLLAAMVVMIWMVACVPAPVTPIEVVQYPNTYTPGPTSTNTPHPPTATLVIQGTPAQLPTRDPNARRVPGAPRDGMGVWLDVTTLKPESLTLLAPRAQIFVESADSKLAHSPNDFYLLQTEGETLPDGFASHYDGVIVKNADAAVLGGLRAKVAPRLVIGEVTSHEASDAASALANADGICFCNFLREPDAPLDSVKTEAAWKRDIDSLAALTTDPNAIVLTATRFPDGAAKNFQEMQFWLDYAAASFLMGVNNTHAFFGFQGMAAQEFLGSPSIAAKLGEPLGVMFQANGVYQRRFRNGLVLVNPTVEAHSFSLARNYVNLSGTALTNVQMQPATGLMLLNSK